MLKNIYLWKTTLVVLLALASSMPVAVANPAEQLKSRERLLAAATDTSEQLQPAPTEQTGSSELSPSKTEAPADKPALPADQAKATAPDSSESKDSKDHEKKKKGKKSKKNKASKGSSDSKGSGDSKGSSSSKGSSDSTGSGDSKGSSNSKDTKEEKSSTSTAPALKEHAQADEKRPYTEAAIKHYNRGVELYQSGFLNQSISEYKSAIDADPRMEESYSNLGLIYVAQRNYSKAVEAFNKALTLKPGRPTTLNGLGAVLYARGKVPEAMEKWKQAVTNDPQFASAYYNMGNAYESEKDDHSALNAYAKALRTNPAMADAFYRAGLLMVKEKHPAQASLLLSKSVELAPDADFVRDAKKQLSALESQLSGGSDEPEVEMNVVPPPADGQTTTKDESSTK